MKKSTIETILMTPIEPRGVASRSLSHVRQKLLAGILTVTPIAVTVFISMWLFQFILDAQWFTNLSDRLRFGNAALAKLAAVVLTLLIVYLVGLLSTTLLFGMLVRVAEHIVARIPVVKAIYNIVKQVTDAFQRPAEGSVSRKFVVVEYPRKGCYGVGFATGESVVRGVAHVHVFLPTTPNPTSGWLFLYPHTEVWETEYSTEEGMKMILSAGIVARPETVLIPYSVSPAIAVAAAEQAGAMAAHGGQTS